MNFSFLPDKVKSSLKDALAGRIPSIIMRASGDILGEPGEGYVIADGTDLLLYSRKLGEAGFREVRTALRDIANFQIEKEGGQSMLVLTIGAETFHIKGSNFEIKELEPVMRRWANPDEVPAAAAMPAGGVSMPTQGKVPTRSGMATAAKPTLPAPGPAAGITAHLGLAVAMMHVAMADGKVAPEEDRYLRHVYQDDVAELKTALAYFKAHTYPELLKALQPLLNHEQKLCILANMMDIGMCDGTLRSSEQRLVREFATAMALTEDEIETIRQVLILKNKISVLAR
jgi:uncharacterized tellurite resistance protein B-like protein